MFNRETIVREEANLRLQLICVARVFGDKQQRPLTARTIARTKVLPKLGSRQRAAGTNQAPPGSALASSGNPRFGWNEYGFGQWLGLSILRSDSVCGTRLYTDTKKSPGRFRPGLFNFLAVASGSAFQNGVDHLVVLEKHHEVCVFPTCDGWLANCRFDRTRLAVL